MMKLCIAEYMKNIKRNIMICILLTAAVLLVLLTIGNIKTTYRYYAAVKDYLGDNGIVSFDVIYTGSELLESALDNIDEVASYKLFEGTSFEVAGEIKEVYLYNDNDIHLLPALKEGRWKKSSTGDETTINVLVSENREGIRAGDVITATYYQNSGDEKKVNLKVMGVFKNGERIAGNLQYKSMYDISYQNFYSAFDSEQNEDYVFVTTKGEYSKLKDGVKYLKGAGIIKYKDGLDREKILQANKKISDFYYENYEGTFLLGNTKLKLVKDNSNVYIKKLIMQFLPFAIVALVLSMMCMISASAVSTLKGLYHYTVYYLTGMKWSGVFKICSFATICNELLSGLMAVMAVNVLRIYRPEIAGRISMSMIEAAVIACIWIVMYVLSVIMPLSILRKNSPARLLHHKLNLFILNI